MSTPAAAPPHGHAAPGPRVDRETYRRLARRVKLLSWVSLAAMGLEGGIAILAGILAGSVALIGFGLDSAIEGFASAIIVWRFTGSRLFSEVAEHRAQKLVAIQFFLLAPYVGFESVRTLVEGHHSEVSRLGIALSASSLVVMPYLGIAKQRIADRIGSAATKGEGRQNVLCAYLAGALLLGLLGNAALGAWWLDPIVGLLIAGVAVKEGVEAWTGEGCACTSDPLASAPAGDEAPAAPPRPVLVLGELLTIGARLERHARGQPDEDGQKHGRGESGPEVQPALRDGLGQEVADGRAQRAGQHERRPEQHQGRHDRDVAQRGENGEQTGARTAAAPPRSP
ncbi:MAG: hypothetical protein QOF29_3358 [bacterium]